MIGFLSQTFGHAELHVEISRNGSDWQLSSLTQVCALCLPPPSTVEILWIEHLLVVNCLEKWHRRRSMVGFFYFRLTVRRAFTYPGYLPLVSDPP
jgi:hypothetical protein